MHINIRPAVLADCERIRPLQQEIADLHYRHRPDLFKKEARFFTEQAFADRLNDPNHTVLIAESQHGEVAGYAFAWIVSVKNHSSYTDFDFMYIDDICVSKGFRRNGIGKKLFENCVQTARKYGCKTVELGVWAFNKEAIAFYRSCGMTDRICRMEFQL